MKMDKYNTFFTPLLYRLVRLDWLCIMLALITITIINWENVNWWIFFIMFWWIDLIGTVPGMYYLSVNEGTEKEKSVPKWCVFIYNICHSFTTVSIITLLWYMTSGPEWAMLAMPIHLAADRCVFGNIYKSFRLKFDPVENIEFKKFYEEFTTS